MHTGVISFCDRIHYNVKSSDTKDALLRRLDAYYQLKIISRHWHRIDARGAQHFRDGPGYQRHWLNVRSNGNPYFMVLAIYEGVETIFFVDKKVQPGYQYPRMILTKGRFSQHLFKDTVLDGEMVRDTVGGWVFLVNDVIAYAGKSMRHLTLPERLSRAADMFVNHHTADAFMDTCLFHVKSYYAATQEGCTALLSAAADLPYTQRGIYAWPDNARLKPMLFNFDEGLIKEVVRKVKDAPEFREAAAVEVPVPQAAPTMVDAPPPPPGGAPTMRLWVRKTETPDIYDLYSSRDGAEKHGIAGVPTLATSKMLRAIFKNLTVALSVPFECAFNERFNKWVPMSRAP
jgi:hypothetical protein